MTATHTYCPRCDACEGFCLASAPPHGVAAPLTIGQHVRHHDYRGRRVTRRVLSLCIEGHAVMATIGLDEPIVIEARSPGRRDAARPDPGNG